MVREKKGDTSLKIYKKKIDLTKVTKDTFKRLLNKKYEVSGKLLPTGNHTFNVDKKSIKNGGKDEADIVEYMYTFLYSSIYILPEIEVSTFLFIICLS